MNIFIIVRRKSDANMHVFLYTYIIKRIEFQLAPLFVLNLTLSLDNSSAVKWDFLDYDTILRDTFSYELSDKTIVINGR